MTSVLEPLTGTARRRRIATRLSGPRRRRLPMLRLVWRQHWVALSVLLTLSAIAIGALILSERFNSRFPAQMWRTYVWQSYGPNYPDLAMQAIPLMAALFVGVQLISRELEDGTAQFAWTQGYGKARWMLCKLAAAAAVLVPMAVVLGLIFAWWYRLYVPATGYFTMHAFALYPPALAGWTIAGLTLGMAAAALTRREGRAMGLTVAGWIGLHHFAIVGSPHTSPGEFWSLQFIQLAILLAMSGLLTGGVIALLQGAPAIAGMPRLLRRLPSRAATNTEVLARQLRHRRIMAVPRAAWREHRTGLLIALGLLGIYGATLVITGLHIHAEPARLRPRYANLAHVEYQPGASTDTNYLLPLLLPFVIGAFLGASLTGTVLDRGTVRFAWVQGVTRTRWAASKLSAIACALVAAAIALGLLFQWWDQPFLAQRLADPWFALHAPVYAGWMAVTVTMGALLGAQMRSRTGAAVFCLFSTLAAAYANAEFLRNHYLPTAAAINTPVPPGSLLVGVDIRSRQAIPDPVVTQIWRHLDTTTGWAAIQRALTRYHASTILTYQPASQFWQLQAIESAGLFTIALLFGAAAVWVLRREQV
ncbi:MAG: hypothetical protein J2P28_01760 [Actinobacteria bacterium]|nr:hypothetical protein [Actinomycetota bacterium]